MSSAARAMPGLVQRDPDVRIDEPIVQAAGPESDHTETSAHNDIAQLAYAHWQHRGCPSGSAETDWLEAELALRERVGAGSRP